MKKENETKPDTDPDPTDKQNGSEDKGSRPDPEPNRTPKKEGIMEVCTRMPHSLKGKMKRDKFTAKGSPEKKIQKGSIRNYFKPVIRNDNPLWGTKSPDFREQNSPLCKAGTQTMNWYPGESIQTVRPGSHGSERPGDQGLWMLWNDCNVI